MAVIHSISEKYGRHMQPSDSATTERLTGCLSGIEKALDAYRGAVDAAGKVNPDLKDAPRAAEQHKMLQAARKNFDKAVEATLDQTRQGFNVARESLRAKIAPMKYDNSTEKLFDLLRAQEIRAELRTMAPEDKRRVLVDAARNGDRSILDAARGALNPIVSPGVLASAEEQFMEAVAHDELQAVEVEKHLIGKAEAIAANAARLLSHMETEAGILPKPPADLAGWTDADKTEFINVHGRRAWAKVLEGVAAPEDFTGDQVAD